MICTETVPLIFNGYFKRLKIIKRLKFGNAQYVTEIVWELSLHSLRLYRFFPATSY